MITSATPAQPFVAIRVMVKNCDQFFTIKERGMDVIIDAMVMVSSLIVGLLFVVIFLGLYIWQAVRAENRSKTK